MNMIVSAATTPRPTVSVAEAKANVTREIDARLKRLTDLEKSVSSNTNLSTKTKDKLEAQLHKDTQGLNHLKETVDHATTASEVRTDRKAMIDDYRVFKMMAPKVAMLEKLARMPVQRWNYKCEDDQATPHIGPMAQDFKAAFFPGRDDKVITTLEFDGVELAAIQGLNQKVEEQRAENAALKQTVEELKRAVESLVKNGGAR